MPVLEPFGGGLGETFQDAAVAGAYRFRPAYSPAVFRHVASLRKEGLQRVLDLGCGTGFVTQGLAPYTGEIDAVDPSAAMLAQAKEALQDAPDQIHWIQSRAEDFAPKKPYSLVTAGDSLHWMDWDIVLPRIASWLEPGGYLAIFTVEHGPAKWDSDLKNIIRRFSTNPAYRPVDMIAELEQRKLFKSAGKFSAGAAYTQNSVDYIESFHARSSLTRARMGATSALAFDDELAALLKRHAGATLPLSAISTVVWGCPLAI